MQMKPTAPPPGGDAVRTASRNGHHSPDAYGPSGRSPWLDMDWREHQRWVRIDGQPVNTIDLGDGPPLVFVHGLTGSWPNWLEQLPVFAREHRVVAMDLPGFGHSPMPRERITISSYARLLDELLDELRIDAAAIVGHSMGGFVSTELAIAFPERVERLVLVSAAGLSTYLSRDATRALSISRRFERILAALTTWGAVNADTIVRRPRLREAIFADLTRHPGLLGAPLAAELVRGGGGKPGFTGALQALSTYSVRDRLPEIACPTLIVWGEHDHLVPVRDADVYAELIPDSRKIVFPDTGHIPQIERPDAFNALLSEFLSE
jgi:pimeloyl-ACP methyl ester carboxylesterase